MTIKYLSFITYGLLIIGCILILTDISNKKNISKKNINANRNAGVSLISSDVAAKEKKDSKPVQTKRKDIAKKHDKNDSKVSVKPKRNNKLSVKTDIEAKSDTDTKNKKEDVKDDNVKVDKSKSIPPIQEVDRSPDLLSQDEQIRIGNEVAVRKKLDHDIFQNKQIEKIAKRLISNLPPMYYGPPGKGWQWNIQCKRTPDHEINAIALMGGRIYVFDGIINLTRDEDELAAVLSHEIIHVVEEHLAEQVEKTEKFQKITGKIVNKVSKGNGQSTKGKAANLAGVLSIVLVQKKLSRKDEYQADEKGFQLLIKAGYNPKKALNIFRRFRKIEISENTKDGIIGEIFSSHPPTEDRIENIQKKIPTYTKSSIDNL